MSWWPPKFDYDLNRPRVHVEQVRQKMPNYRSAVEVDRIQGISAEDFNKRYVLTRTPAVLTGAVVRWPAFSDWEVEYLRRFVGTEPVRVTKCLFADLLLMRVTKRLFGASFRRVHQEWNEHMPMSDYLDLCTTRFDP